jgi:chemotaxis protein methyltransferase CheR
MELTRQEFNDLSGYIHKLCGLHIQPDKQYLILQRLAPLLDEQGCQSFTGFYRMLVERPTAELQQKIIAAITTNETSFFRDGHPFETFKSHILPHLAEVFKVRKRLAKTCPPPKIRIWSAAASTGQEAYSLAIMVREYAYRHHYLGVTAEDFSILGTDISSEALTRASAGRYNEIDVGRGLALELRDKYFLREERSWVVRSELRRMVEFRKLNLTERFGLMTVFDCIFCRNVLIYFDEPTKRVLADRFHAALADHGALILGSAENLYNVSEKFESRMLGETIVYKKK